ncbi:DNA polymerase III subunit gamma/tau [Candidatus Saccharibacteria bacterium]|nr:DNA polymerase III subunit gamma/tau [Candidatus Saccharibacteria bacterium]
MKSLYRKYRPLRLVDVVGQEQVTIPLENAIEAGKISHAYLFVGPRGCGKTSVARILAHAVNGFDYKLEDDYVDIIEIDGASNRGIDNIRDLREKVMIAPTKGKYKVYIIDEVHMLTKEAFNALLKTLEEPPAHAIFIMATTDAYKVPVTITSRAQTYTFKLADSKVMFDYLKKIVEEEKIKISDEALKLIVKHGGGSFRDTLSLLDQISTFSDKEITKGMVISAMGLPQDEKIAELLAEYQNGDTERIAAILKDLLSSGVKAETLAEELISSIIEKPNPELLPLLAKLPDVKAPFADAKLLVALAEGKGLVQRHFSVDNQANDVASSSDGRPRARSFPQHFTQSSPRSSLTSASAESNITRLGRGNVDKNDSGSAGELSEEPATSSAQFDWNDYLEKVQGLSDAVYSQLAKTESEFKNNVLHIYPPKKIVKSILSRDNNKKILVEAAGGKEIEIHDADEAPGQAKKDETLNRISDIMGGEVKNDGGGNPF